MATTSLNSWTWRFFGSAMLASAALLSACGGGSGNPAATTLSGTAAVGAPIASGTVKVTCSGGSAQTTTSSAGGWSVSVSGLTLPCAVQVSGGLIGSVANTTPYHSIALTTGIVNVTPLTDLIVAQMLGSTPATWFANPVFTNVSSTALSAALNSVSTNLGIGTTLGSVDPITSAFLAQNGDKLDDVLEAIKAALTNLSKTYADLLAAAQANNYTTVSGFGTAFTTSYGNLAGGASCASGETQFVFSASTTVSSTFSDGQSVCFTASTTSLSFSGKTLTSPVQNTVVTSPYSAYKFTDAADSYEYEVIFNGTDLYEINLTVPPDFAGQFAAPVGGSGVGGAGSLTVDTTVSGLTTSVNVPGVPAPADQTSFCADIVNDNSLTSLSAGGGTLTINSCTYSGNVGTINATLVFGVSIPYVVTYTYN